MALWSGLASVVVGESICLTPLLMPYNACGPRSTKEELGIVGRLLGERKGCCSYWLDAEAADLDGLLFGPVWLWAGVNSSGSAPWFGLLFSGW